MDRFKSVPVEPGTRVHHQELIRVGEHQALHQWWSWEGIKAESLVFLTADVQGLGEQRLKSLLVDNGLADSSASITYKQDDSGFTFINFNFVT